MREVNLLSGEESRPASEAKRVKQIIEAVLFASAEPLTIRKLQQIVASDQELPAGKVRELLCLLREEYDQLLRGFELVEVAGGWVVRSRKEYSPYIQQLRPDFRPLKLSKSASEVLAIIAYRQPVTRPIIEGLRGVDSSGPVRILLERKLIEIAGRAQTPGRPVLYATTRRFLNHFGLRDIRELPQLKVRVEKS